MMQKIKEKRQEMKDEQEKLNSSLNTPLCKSEEAVLLKKTWMSEVKNLSILTDTHSNNAHTLEYPKDDRNYYGYTTATTCWGQPVP